jgi:transcriptional regulator with XRE-family HTH domain
MPRPVRNAPAFDAASEAKRQAGLRLKAARLTLGLSAEVMATELGLTRTALTAQENGQNTPDPLVMARMLRRFGITLEWIYAGELRYVRDFDFQEALRAKAAELGAVVGAPVAEFPMEVEHLGRQPGAAPKRRRPPGATIHEPPAPFSPRPPGSR